MIYFLNLKRVAREKKQDFCYHIFIFSPKTWQLPALNSIKKYQFMLSNPLQTESQHRKNHKPLNPLENRNLLHNNN